MSSRKREDIWPKPKINKCYFGKICIYLWQISSSATFVSIWLLLNSYPYPKCQRLFTRGFQFGQVFIVTTLSPHARRNPWYPGYFCRAFIIIGSSIFLRDLQRPWLRFFGRRVTSRVKRFAPMVCHALVVCLWGLGVPFVDFTGVPHRYCTLLWSW